MQASLTALGADGEIIVTTALTPGQHGKLTFWKKKKTIRGSLLFATIANLPGSVCLFLKKGCRDKSAGRRRDPTPQSNPGPGCAASSTRLQSRSDP